MADFVIALHYVKWNGTLLTTYFGKIKGICRSLSRRKNIIHIHINTIATYIKLSALGHQCTYQSEDHFRQALELA
jgi:hypothetical protein